MVDSEPVEAGQVALLISVFEHAVALARGAPKTNAPEAPNVPRTDMAAAHLFAQAVLATVTTWRRQASSVRWPVMTAGYVEGRLAAVVASARALETATRLALESAPPQSLTTRPVAGGWPAVWIADFVVARELLEIAVGERPMEGSDIAIAGEESAHGILIGMPVLGELVAAFEAATGHTITTWRRLSVTERVFSAVGVLAPLLLGAAAKGIPRATVITRRAVLTALAARGMLGLLTKGQPRLFALRIVIGQRLLSEEDFREFLRILRSPGSLRSAPHADVVHFTYCLTRCDYLARQAQWLAHAEAEGRTAGYGALKGATPNDVEKQIGSRLANATGKPVTMLPEILPEAYPGGKKVQGVTHPDALWGDRLCDFREVRGGTAENAVKYTAAKARQANTVVVMLNPLSKITPADYLAHLDKLWADPTALAIEQVVLLGDTGARILERPGPYWVPLARGVARGTAPNLRRLIDTAREVAAEPEPKTR